jgi:hypothetical protein
MKWSWSDFYLLSRNYPGEVEENKNLSHTGGYEEFCLLGYGPT